MKLDKKTFNICGYGFLVLVLIMILILFNCPIEDFSLEQLHNYIFVDKKNCINDKNNCITIIISRYNEDVNWVNKIINNNYIEKVIIFNKGLQNIDYIYHDKIEIYNVENIGREGGTYLDYIINNYDNFPENLIFTQADPFEHNSSFINFAKNNNLKYIIENYSFLSLTRYYKIHWPLENVEYYNSIVLDDFICNNYLIDKYSLNIVGPCKKIDESRHYKNSLKKYNYGDSFMDYLCENLNINKPKKIMNFNMAACFFVKSKQIMRHPIEVYIKLNEFLYNTNMQGGIEGYILERFWNYLFTGKSYDTITDCLKELFIDIESIAAIYCDKEDKFVFKNINDFNNIIQNENKYLIYKKLNNDIKILPGIDLDSPEIKNMDYDTVKIAKNLENESRMLLKKMFVHDINFINKVNKNSNQEELQD